MTDPPPQPGNTPKRPPPPDVTCRDGDGCWWQPAGCFVELEAVWEARTCPCGNRQVRRRSLIDMPGDYRAVWRDPARAFDERTHEMTLNR